MEKANVVFEEFDDFYKTKKGEHFQAAKMFYKLTINDMIYKVVIRHKGSFSASPQFVTENI